MGHQAATVMILQLKAATYVVPLMALSLPSQVKHELSSVGDIVLNLPVLFTDNFYLLEIWWVCWYN